MIELIRHLLGLCPDHATHLNLFDAMLTTGALAFAGPYVTRLKSIFWRKTEKPPQKSADNAPSKSCSCDEHAH